MEDAKVNPDYHISVEGHLHSLPYRLVGADISVRLTATMLEVMHEGTRVAAHARSAMKGRHTTRPRIARCRINSTNRWARLTKQAAQ